MMATKQNTIQLVRLEALGEMRRIRSRPRVLPVGADDGGDLPLGLAHNQTEVEEDFLPLYVPQGLVDTKAEADQAAEPPSEARARAAPAPAACAPGVGRGRGGEGRLPRHTPC